MMLIPLVSNLNRKLLPDTPGGLKDNNLSEQIMILQSPLKPAIPIGSLQGIDDGTILVLKHFSTDLCADAIRRLYHILPDLHFSSQLSDSPVQDDTVGDTGAEIVCAWFRIMILNDSEADALERATRCRSIGEYLSGCQASQLETYCDFFEKAWRPHAVQYLRVAICAQTLAGGDIKTVRLLSGDVPSTSEGLRMTKPCWDILHRWFPTLLTPWTVASICSNFEDYTTLCKLLMLGLYRDNWYNPSGILSECATGIYFGFIPTSKGEFSKATKTIEKDHGLVQTQARNYLCGQMAIGDPMTQYFLDELRRRTERLYLVVYEGTNVDATVHPTEADLFIKRTRSVQDLTQDPEADWTTTITLEDIKNDIRLRKTSMYDPIVVDSWQFIIIDREVGMPFDLIDIVQDTLLMLAGDPSPRRIAKRVVSEVIPPSVQEMFMEEMSIECSADMRFPAPPEVQYEGHRYRHYSPDRNAILTYQKRTATEIRSRDSNRFIRRVVDDMERCGIVSLVQEYEEPQTRPIIMQGSDGALDLYFPYDHSDKTTMIPELPLPTPNCLLDFARAFKQQNPDGIMAKGSIQTHYCAWPMPFIKSLGNIGLTFATWEGHIYRWNAMPDRADAEDQAAMLLEETEDRGWRVVLPRSSEWKSDIDELKLNTLYEGVKPA
ncbi:hypothetical protein J4E93_009899 [Alternaria ventricosa]|uniref:uncharacterized protein n=1 Tax=Alternaria ventricosa TaxID=1187951 RepID=UPI0020C58A36|nr:uncharacterized protein J4E93_009899 [Alternaria ventricosa]KAI4638598.1 hypothetical protein J4E93_009899 [Alternaria ventricosa]